MPDLTPPDGPRELPPTGEHTTGSLGRYKILGELGRGGCGIVYRALDPSIGRMVAIKTILAKTDCSPGKESRERFRREARAAGNLSHPNIVTVHDFSDSGDPMYIAMEFIEGRTLAEAMSRGPLALDFILGVLRSAADALDYAHAHHIVHRDIKPANFLINESGRLKITDFGIAKLLDSEDGLTSTGMVVGTAQYMSPEQISEMHVTGRSDQFSLAVIAYEMLAGVKPFPGNSWATVIHAIIMAEPAPITKYRNTLGDGVDTVLRKALSKDPLQRYETCTEFCDALQRQLSGAVIERTLVFAKHPDVQAPVAAVEEKTRVSDALPPGTKSSGPSTTREILPALAKSPPAANKPWTPVLIGAVGAVVIAAGAWIGLRSMNPRLVPQTTAEAPALRLPPSAPASTPETEAKPVIPAPETKQTVKAKEQTKVQAKVEPRKLDKAPVITSQAAPPPAPVTIPNNPAPPKVETAPVVPVQAVPTPTPTPVAPPPTPVPTKAPDDQAKRADEQAKRLADEQTRRTAEDQARRLSDEQAKNARIAENAAISRTLRNYQDAYERKDLAALQATWPSIPKPVLDGIRGSFRDASAVSMDLRAVGDPKVSGNTATVICDRNLRQVILNRALQASGRIRIVLNRTGSGWVIQSVESVN